MTENRYTSTTTKVRNAFLDENQMETGIFSLSIIDIISQIEISRDKLSSWVLPLSVAKQSWQ